MPTVVGIVTFISMINTTSKRLKARNFFICQYFSFTSSWNVVLSLVEHENSFGSGSKLFDTLMYSWYFGRLRFKCIIFDFLGFFSGCVHGTWNTIIFMYYPMTLRQYKVMWSTCLHNITFTYIPVAWTVASHELLNRFAEIFMNIDGNEALFKPSY